MKLHFLGTTGYHPNNHRQTACLMVPELGLIFDAGTGIFRARDLIQTSTLDIFLSHVHLDHCVGLTFLYDVLWQKELERVTVHVEESKMDTLRNALYHRDLFPVEPNFDIRPLQETTVLEQGKLQATIDSIPVAHPGGCHAFKVTQANQVWAYVTDTMADAAADYVPRISEVTTLIHECYFPDGWEDRAKLTGHSCLTPVAEVAATTAATSLYLVHINPLNEDSRPLDLDSVSHIFSNITVAHDEMVIDI